MKKNKRIIGILLSMSLVLITSNIVFATTNTGLTASEKASSNKVIAYMKPEFSVQVNQKMQIFKNAKGQRVYPIVYNGSTYLPVRAIASLMSEDIQWDENSRTVYIGKTLINPNKSKLKKNTKNMTAAQGFDKKDYIQPTWKSAQITASVRKDINIMYDFEIQKFTNVNGNQIYPIVYEESTYMPIRSISALMKEQIDWDNVTKTIIIGSKEQNQEGEDEAKDSTIYTKRLKAELERSVELYDQATAKIVEVQNTTDSALKVMLADSISSDVQAAEKQTIEINSMRKSKMTDEEKAAQGALQEFATISEHYLLVLENIAYMAAAKEDYYMLLDTFVNFALESQTKMNKARELVDAL